MFTTAALHTTTLKKFAPLISLVLFVLAAIIVNHPIANYGWPNVVKDLFECPSETLGPMLIMAVFGYGTLSVCEWIAIQYTREKLDYKYILFGSFLSNAISHNVGSSLISGGSIRYRFYRDWGLSRGAIAQITVFGTISYFLSAFTLLIITTLAASKSITLDNMLANGPR